MKKHNLAFLLVLVSVALNSFVTNGFAQKVSSVKNEQNISVSGNEILQKYIEVSEMTQDERRKSFNTFSNEVRAGLFKFHLALQLAKNPDFSREQKDLILESVSTISAELYDRTKRNPTLEAQIQSIDARARTLFPKENTAQMFGSLGGNENDAKELKLYRKTIEMSFDEKVPFIQTLTAKEKSTIWRIHLIFNLAKKETLSGEQKNLILEGISMASTELFSTNKDSTEWQKLTENLKSLEAKIRVTFSKEEGAEIFTNLGKTALCKTGNCENTNNLRAWCNCANDNDWCWRGECWGGAGGCRNNVSCGVFGNWNCDGLCSSL